MRDIDTYISNINEDNVKIIRESIIEEINSPTFISNFWKKSYCEDFESLVVVGITRSFIKVNKKKISDLSKLKDKVINILSMNILLRNRIINLIDNYDYSEFRSQAEQLIDQKLMSKYHSS